MLYIGKFIDNNDQYEYEVRITTSGSGSKEIEFPYDSPIVLTQENDGLFSPIKTHRATIQIISNDYLFDLYNTGWNVVVEIRKYLQQNSYTVVFKGYVTPCIYRQDYDNISIISIECISEIAMLKYKDYTPISTNKDIYSVYDIIKHCLTNTNYNMFILVTKNILGIDNTTYTDILKQIYLDENNFFDDDEEKTPWKVYEVLEEIAKILSFSFVEDSGNLYLINYKSGMENSCYFTSYNMQNDGVSEQATLLSPTEITPQSYYSSGNNLSLDETYKLIEVKANTYPYEDIFTNILNSENWLLHPDYSSSAQAQNPFNVTNSMNVPSFQWSISSGDAKGSYAAYFLYYVSNLITPYKYSVNGNDILEPTVNPNEYITTCNIAANYDQEQSRYYVGPSLIKVAEYNIEKSTLISSLDWKDQIIIYTGVNNFTYTGINDSQYTTYKNRIIDYLENNFCSFDGNYYPIAPLIKVESASNMIISTDSYMVINGKISINDLEYDNTQPKEFNTGDWFKEPIAFKLIDTAYGSKDRDYYGFPVIAVQIRIGNNICWSKWNRPTNTTRISYKWSSTKPPQDEGWEDWQPYIEIPVGTDEFAYYKFYEITNTCDWRLGLDNAKGFAIPLPKANNLHGKMEVYILGPVYYLYSRYITGHNIMKKLPQVLSTYEITRNPGDIWDNGWNSGTFGYTVSYEGTYPNCILIQDLAFDIKEVVYFSISDTAKTKKNNKKTDHKYTNELDNSNVNDKKSIECKINTQDTFKFRSFSSLMKGVQGAQGIEYQYVEKMMNDGSNYRIQENNVVQDYSDHYSNKKIIFECNLNGCDFSNIDVMYNNNIQNGTKMIVNNKTEYLREANTELELVEI